MTAVDKEPRRNLLMPMAVTIGLGTVLTVLLLAGRTPDAGLTQRLEEALGNYALHDAQLTRDVLLARAGLLPSYDPLAGDETELDAALERLRSEVDGASRAARVLLGAPLADLARVHQSRQVAAEHFKSLNALQRNSLLYFAYLGPALRVPARDASLVRDLGSLSYAVLGYLQMPDPQREQQLVNLLDRIDAMGAREMDLRSMSAHAHLLVQVLPEVDAQLRILQDPLGSHRVELLRSAAMRYDAARQQRVSLWRAALYALAVAILVSLAWTWVRLRVRAQELRAAEAELQAQRLRLVNTNGLVHLGTHLEGVVHNLRSPMQSVSSTASQLMGVMPALLETIDEVSGSDPSYMIGTQSHAQIRKTLQEMQADLQSQSRSLLELAQLLLELGRAPTGRSAPVNVNQLITKNLRLVRHAIEKGTLDFRFDAGEGLPQVMADSRALGLVLVNLLNNALEALPSRERAVQVRTRRGDPGWVLVEIDDEGDGIASEHLARLFEPFFTTKEGRDGTGLGLALSRSALEEMGGRLHLANRPTGGARATISLMEAAQP